MLLLRLLIPILSDYCYQVTCISRCDGVGPDRYMTVSNIGSYDFGTHTGQNMDNFGTSKVSK